MAKVSSLGVECRQRNADAAQSECPHLRCVFPHHVDATIDCSLKHFVTRASDVLSAEKAGRSDSLWIVRLRSSAPISRHAATLAARTIFGMAVSVLVLSACGSTFDGAQSSNKMAISGGLGTLSVADLKAEMEMLASNEAFVTDVLGGKSVRVGKGYDEELVATVMQQHLFDDIITKEAAARNIKPIAMSEEVTQAVLSNLNGSQAALDGFSEEYRNRLFLTQRTIQPLVEGVQDKLAKPYFDANQSQFAEACVSHLLVETEAEATTARDRIAKGESFADVAKAVSKDPGSGEKGGDLGCTPLTAYVEPFSTEAGKLPINELSKPVKTEFGFHIIKVTKRDKPVWNEQTKTVARGKVNEAAITEIRTSIGKRVKAANIVVNPNYGVLDSTEEIPSIKPKGSANTTVTPPASTTKK